MHGLRMTTQRRIILEELKKTDSHPTADDVYRRVRTRLPRISLGTVYRNLGLLAEGGLVQKLDGGGGRSRFDGDTADHYHCRCLICDRVIDLPGVTLPAIDRELKGKTSFRIVGHRLELVGYCPECDRSGHP
jgi:Fur family ferric uptake transcriptional regulator